MTPEQKAMAKERGAKAVKEMKQCGFPGKKITIVIKKLLKSLDFNWELIEAENYSVLVDAIISFEEPEEEPLRLALNGDNQVDDDNGAIVPAEIPLHRKKRHGTNHEEQFLTAEVVLKKPKLEVDTLPEEHIQKNKHNQLEKNTGGSTVLVSPKTTSNLGPSDPVSILANAKGKGILIDGTHGQSGPTSPRACLGPPDPVNALANTKGKEILFHSMLGDSDPISPRECLGSSDPVNSNANAKGKEILVDSLHLQFGPTSPRECRREKGPTVGRVQPLIGLKEPKIEPDMEHIPNIVNTTVCQVGHPPLEGPVADGPFPCSAKAMEGHLDPNPRDYDENGCLSSGTNRKGEVVSNENRSAEHIVPTANSSSGKVELASSVDNSVKLVLSWEETNADFQMPSVKSVLNVVEDKWLQSRENTSPEFSLNNILTEMCQIFSKMSKTGDTGHGSCH